MLKFFVTEDAPVDGFTLFQEYTWLNAPCFTTRFSEEAACLGGRVEDALEYQNTGEQLIDEQRVTALITHATRLALLKY